MEHTDITCATCKTVPPEKVLNVSVYGHATVHGNTGRAAACSIDGGYRERIECDNCGRSFHSRFLAREHISVNC